MAVRIAAVVCAGAAPAWMMARSGGLSAGALRESRAALQQQALLGAALEGARRLAPAEARPRRSRVALNVKE
jgi:hypothetical protein